MAFPLRRVADGDWQSLRRVIDNIAQRLNPPMPNARASNTANISAANNTVTYLTFDSEQFDNGALHSTSANTGRLTAPITGIYLIGASVTYANNATGRRQTRIRVDGTTTIVLFEPDTNQNQQTSHAFSTLWPLAAGSYVEVGVFQNSGGALNVVAAEGSPELWMVRLGGYVNTGV